MIPAARAQAPTIARKGRRLSFTWSWDHDDIDTTVTIEFLPAEGGTGIRIAHAYVFADEREGYVEGWLHFLGRLREIHDNRCFR